jgi:hypothetical protein
VPATESFHLGFFVTLALYWWLLCAAVFVDGQASKVPHLMLWSAGCYTATALFYSFKSGLQVRGWQHQCGMLL